MYKKCSIILYICIVLIGFLWIFMKKSSLNEASQKSILSYRVSDLEEIVDTFREMEASEDELGYVDKHETIAIRVSKENEFFSPKMHRVNYQVIQKENRIVLDENDYDILCCIVEAEDGGEDYLGKKLVAEVVLVQVVAVPMVSLPTGTERKNGMVGAYLNRSPVFVLFHITALSYRVFLRNSMLYVLI